MIERGEGGSPLSVRIRSLSLRAFRNYESLDLEPDPGLTLIVGPNGQGKTNLVEAIYFLCLGRSFRERRDKRLIMFGSQASVLRGEYEWEGRTHTIEIALNRSGPKVVKVDGAPLTRLRELLGRVPVVGLTPEDGEIVRGEPGARRRFLDIVLAQTNIDYLEALRRYRRALAQRNTCLRNGSSDLAITYEDELARSGGLIHGARARLVDFLAGVAADAYRAINNSGEAFTITYRPSPADQDKGMDLAYALARTRGSDFERGFTGVGPHRDDVHLAVNRRDLRLYGSHGQARTALATLKLAEVSYYTGAYDRPPILVMDEVTSVLDRERAGNLVKLLSEEASQVFLTSPGEEELGGVAEEAGCVVLVDGGKAKIRR